jgi:hypothetical protein
VASETDSAAVASGADLGAAASEADLAVDVDVRRGSESLLDATFGNDSTTADTSSLNDETREEREHAHRPVINLSSRQQTNEQTSTGNPDQSR